jgi:hypothetical protein
MDAQYLRRVVVEASVLVKKCNSGTIDEQLGASGPYVEEGLKYQNRSQTNGLT